jgi:hypothetical protein
MRCNIYLAFHDLMMLMMMVVISSRATFVIGMGGFAQPKLFWHKSNA